MKFLHVETSSVSDVSPARVVALFLQHVAYQHSPFVVALFQGMLYEIPLKIIIWVLIFEATRAKLFLISYQWKFSSAKNILQRC